MNRLRGWIVRLLMRLFRVSAPLLKNMEYLPISYLSLSLYPSPSLPVPIILHHPSLSSPSLHAYHPTSPFSILIPSQMIVIASIHQPSTTTLELFDNVLLLSQ